MNAASIAVVAVVLALAVFAVWRNLKKGTPCECGGECRCCKKSHFGHCGCRE